MQSNAGEPWNACSLFLSHLRAAVMPSPWAGRTRPDAVLYPGTDQGQTPLSVTARVFLAAEMGCLVLVDRPSRDREGAGERGAASRSLTVAARIPARPLNAPGLPLPAGGQSSSSTELLNP